MKVKFLISFALILIANYTFAAITDAGSVRTPGADVYYGGTAFPSRDAWIHTAGTTKWAIVPDGRAGVAFYKVYDDDYSFPNEHSYLLTDDNPARWFSGVNVYNNEAYIACNCGTVGGLRIYNISNLPNAIENATVARANRTRLRQLHVEPVGENVFIYCLANETAQFITVNRGSLQNNAGRTLSQDAISTKDIANATLYNLDVAVLGGTRYAFIASGENGLLIFSVSDAGIIGGQGGAGGDPWIYNTAGSAQGIAVSGNYAYVSDGANGLVILDVSTPTSPSLVKTVSGMVARDIHIEDNYAYVTDNDHGIAMVDISTPATAYILSVLKPNGGNSEEVRGISKSENYIYYNSGNNLRAAYLTNSDYEVSIPYRQYKMIGVPINIIADYRQPGTLFGHIGLGTLGTNWRFSRWNVEFQTFIRAGENNYPNNTGPAEPPDIIPGHGYWLQQISGRPIILDIPENRRGDAVSLENSYSVTPLQSKLTGPDRRGINMIANPYPKAYKWEATKVTKGGVEKTLAAAAAENPPWISQYASIYNGTAFQALAPDATNRIAPWEGFWFEVLTTDPVTITFYPAGTNALPPSEEDFGNPYRDNPLREWQLYLTVSTEDGAYSDPYNIAGVHSHSRGSYDYMDASEFSSMCSQFVQLYFPRPDWEEVIATEFTYDYRTPEFEEPEVWDFNVRSQNLPNQVIELTWPTIDDIHPAYSFSLEDENRNTLIEDLRGVDVYRFNSGDNNLAEFSFRLIATYTPVSIPNESSAPILDNLTITRAYPNPFNSEVQIHYTLPQQGQIKLQIFDLQGRHIEDLVSGNLTAGTYTTLWDAKQNASGMYLVRLEQGGINTQHRILLLR